MKGFIKIISVCITVVMLLCGCKSNSASKNRTIAVSIAPQAAFVKAVCGDKFEVITMIPPSASPETYEPTAAEFAAFGDAEVYFTVGVSAENNSILPNVSEKTQVVNLEKSVAEKYEDIKLGESRDPHIWLSPKRAAVMVEEIAEKLCEIDSQNADFYKNNAQSYIEKLEKIDGDIRESLKDVKNKKIIVYHPAFGYFCNDYGLEMYALEEEGKEATAKRLAEMVDLAKKENIKVIFYQAENSGRQAKTFAEEIGGKAVMLEPLSEDYTANLEKTAQIIKKEME